MLKICKPEVKASDFRIPTWLSATPASILRNASVIAGTIERFPKMRRSETKQANISNQQLSQASRYLDGEDQ